LGNKVIIVIRGLLGGGPHKVAKVKVQGEVHWGNDKHSHQPHLCGNNVLKQQQEPQNDKRREKLAQAQAPLPR
jgi:hypothetical protein